MEAGAASRRLGDGGDRRAAGLAPTLAAIRRGPIVALANKEVLVCAGTLVMQEVSRMAQLLLPVDSEAQCDLAMLRSAPTGETIERIILDSERRAVSRAQRRGTCAT